ncbi:Uncharacterised protein [Candidatus Burarchaeum australiense]|nr:Uncharacterised protein [Candidatus Burarchaeum australiense]
MHYRGACLGAINALLKPGIMRDSSELHVVLDLLAMIHAPRAWQLAKKAVKHELTHGNKELREKAEKVVQIWEFWEIPGGLHSEFDSVGAVVVQK